MAETYGVVMLNMGGPAKADAVEDFIRALLSDPYVVNIRVGFVRRAFASRIAKHRAPFAREHYALLGGGSPILANTRAQAAALEAALGGAIPVRVAMRYSSPRAAEAVAELREMGVTTLVALPLYPQASAATTRSSLEDLAEAVRAAGLTLLAPPWNVGYPTLPGLLDAFAEPILAKLAEHPEAHVLFSAHGLPERQARRDPYPAEVRACAEALAARLPQGTSWSLAFQSRLGPVRWLAPYLDNEVRHLAEAGTRALIVVPISFVSEHVETLYELDIELAAIAREAGVTHYARIATPGVHAAFIAGLAERVGEWIAAHEQRTTNHGL